MKKTGKRLLVWLGANGEKQVIQTKNRVNKEKNGLK